MSLELEECRRFKFYQLAIIYGSFLKECSFRDIAIDADRLNYKLKLEEEFGGNPQLPDRYSDTRRSTIMVHKEGAERMYTVIHKTTTTTRETIPKSNR